MSALFKRIRILPVVMLLAAGTLALKGSDLFEIARAQAAAAAGAPGESTSEPAPAGGAGNEGATSDPAAEDSSESPAELDVLTSLSKRRAEIDARSKELDMRANLLAAAEKRVDAKIADLKTLQSQIQQLLGKRDEAEDKQLAGLVKVYSAMKPRDAGRIFNSLEPDVLLDVARSMKPDALAAIMATMNPQAAQDLTVKIANRLKLPAKPETAAAQQLAAAIAPPVAPAQGADPAATAAAGPPQAPAPSAVPPAAPGGAPAANTSAPAGR